MKNRFSYAALAVKGCTFSGQYNVLIKCVLLFRSKKIVRLVGNFSSAYYHRVLLDGFLIIVPPLING